MHISVHYIFNNTPWKSFSVITMSPTEEKKYTSPHLMQIMTDVHEPKRKLLTKIWGGIKKGLGCFDKAT